MDQLSRQFDGRDALLRQGPSCLGKAFKIIV